MGASTPFGGMFLDRLLPGGVVPPGRGTCPLCRASRDQGSATTDGRLVLHIDCLRLRAVDRLAEAWIRTDAGAVVPVHGGGAGVADAEPAAPAGEREERKGHRHKARTLRDRFLTSRLDVPSTLAAAAYARSDKGGDDRRSSSRRTKRSRSRKHPKKGRSRTSSRSSSSGGSRSVFRDASSRTSSAPASVMVSTKPGELYAQTIGAITKKVQARGGAGGDGASLQHFLST